MATPSIVLVPDRYKSGVLYSQLPESGAVDFDVTRATTAYRTNASGVLESVASGVPRLDYPASGGCPALLVEPAATNLALYSEEFDNAAWVKSGVTVSPNDIIAPDGTLSADKIIPSVALTPKFINQENVNPTAPATSSVFIRPAGYSVVQMTTLDSDFVAYDLSTQTVVASTGNVTGRIQVLNDGWFRISFTRLTATHGRVRVAIVPSLASSRFEAFSGDGVSGVHLWGAQLETDSVATSYIPTVASTVTRNADVITKTGVSGFIGQTEGTLYAEVDLRNVNIGSKTILNISEGTTSNRIDFGISNSNLFYIIRISATESTSTVVTVSGPVTAGIYKIAVGYKSGDTRMYINGLPATSQITDTFTFVNALSKFNIGSSRGDIVQLNDRIRAAAIYTSRLSNAELAALTTL